MESRAVGDVNTCVPVRAPESALALAIAVVCGAAVLLCPRTGAAAPAATEAVPAPIVFFWSSPGRAEPEKRRMLAAVQAAAAAAGARVFDLSPPAGDPPDAATRVSRAVAAYDSMRFADAIVELDAAASQAAEHGAWGLTRDALVDLFLYRALAKTESGDEAGAWSDFVRAATIDPARVLDPARFRPSAVKSFARAVQEAAARAPVALSVSAPASARIYIDGRASGGEQVSEALLPGEHYVWVARPEAAPFGRAITLAAPFALVVPDDAARLPVDRELRRRAGRLASGTPLVVALSRQGGIDAAELRSLDPDGTRGRGAVRLGPSPEANARDLGQVVERALREVAAADRSRPDLVAARPSPGTDRRRWYQSRWLWVAVGAAGALIAVTPFLLDSSDGTPGIPGTLDPGPLE
ncbi:MAG TPA: hypothetical protein VKB80_17255 [Kofleriaceae bacterium]|nr:hypothetical protein [Kofleriaceae bacterium]